MEYYLTRHAREKLAERSVSIATLEGALFSPTEVRTDGKGKQLFVKLYRRSGKERLLLVVVVREGAGLKIITAIDTSKVRKYLG